jgi:hypothetical protein
MKIQSRLKDYYDYVEHAYGGGDPLCMYVRDRVVPKKIEKNRLGTWETEPGFTIPYAMQEYVPNDIRRKEDATVAEFKGLSVVGRHYLIERRMTTECVPQEVDPWHVTKREFRNFVQGQKSERLLNLSKLVNAPVFIFDTQVEGRCPILADLGFGAFMDAHQLYQELAIFISNELHPFEDPEIPTTDVQKAEAHGFDKRQSFRHRK